MDNKAKYIREHAGGILIKIDDLTKRVTIMMFKIGIVSGKDIDEAIDNAYNMVLRHGS